MDHWPLPPFFKDASESAESGPLEAMYLTRAGEAIRGRLMVFAPETGAFDFEVAGTTVITRVPLSALRSLHLLTSIVLVQDDALMALYREAGGDAIEPTARPFTVKFAGGETLHGDTRGFVRTGQGLYLFLATHDDRCLRLFIPEGAFLSLRIGTLLGELLVESGAVAHQQVAAALGEQSSRRQMLLDDHLGDRRIDSPEALAAVVERRGAVSPHIRIGDILVGQGLVSRDQMFEALDGIHADKSVLLGQILIDKGILTSARLARAVADQLGVPIVSLQHFTIAPDVIAMVDAAFAMAHKVLPLLVTERSLIVAVENPVEAWYLDALRFSTQRQVIPVIAGAEELAARIELEYASRAQAGAAANIKTEIDELGARLTREATRATGTSGSRQVTESDTLLVRLVNSMIIYAHSQGASDIHVEAYPDGTPTRIRFRIDGVMSDYLQLPSELRPALISRLKIMADLDISEHRKPQDGKIDFQRFAPLKLELRVASLPTANGLEDIVMRLLSSTTPTALDKMGISADIVAQLRVMVHKSYGLILVCGPTGSGKTTTLHSLLAEVNTPENKIWTAEDPIEITHPGLRQIQVIPRAGLTFATAMRAFLRADPDIIMIGEMRDPETTKIAIEASLTGHLVLSTLHTNSAPESVVRLLDLGIDPFNFADALVGVLGQRLARRLCTDCKAPVANPEADMEQMADEFCAGMKFDRAAVIAGWRARFGSPKGGIPPLCAPVGCEHCHHSGYRGRVGLYELMVATPRVKRLIQARSPVEALNAQAVEEGMLMLRQYGIHVVLQGITDARSVHSACS